MDVRFLLISPLNSLPVHQSRWESCLQMDYQTYLSRDSQCILESLYHWTLTKIPWLFFRGGGCLGELTARCLSDPTTQTLSQCQQQDAPVKGKKASREEN